MCASTRSSLRWKIGRTARFERDRIELTITDNGIGRNPRAWSHGLGLGGVCKRVKQLDGDAEWRKAGPRSISCRVTMRQISARW